MRGGESLCPVCVHYSFLLLFLILDYWVNRSVDPAFQNLQTVAVPILGLQIETHQKQEDVYHSHEEESWQYLISSIRVFQFLKGGTCYDEHRVLYVSDESLIKEIWKKCPGTTLGIYRMLLDCSLKKWLMVNFMLCEFYLD